MSRENMQRVVEEADLVSNITSEATPKQVQLRTEH